MIPPLIRQTPSGPRVLPVGVYRASLLEVKQKFAWNAHRRTVFRGFLKAMRYLRSIGCRRFYLAGSFVTSKPNPGDFDGCWDPTKTIPGPAAAMFFDMPRQRALQKAIYGGELYPGVHDVPGFEAWPKFFQQDTRRGISKGILEIVI